ncbi:hypothetical protein L6452_25917 [Arctium lappa]|uniref:Uncharacterized protein n=1 Tax=Arctium lappa TaxID=4217 RepID=A0ACB9ABE4_ARCLA|nr:hypothetical protein L6452_25917 [Arctium lappa]
MDSKVAPFENVPRALPKDQNPSLIDRNTRMLGQLLGTLDKFRIEDMKLSGSEEFMRRFDLPKRVEQRAHEKVKDWGCRSIKGRICPWAIMTASADTDDYISTADGSSPFMDAKFETVEVVCLLSNSNSLIKLLKQILLSV